MCLRVFGTRVMTVVGREERRAQLRRDRDELRIRLVLCGDAVVLQLDEEIVSPEDVL